uniref:Uncharacterized protein n=1 Tax=Fagus sylvatica TaxID=28930 RepID=A0A2N9F934_FAGSY
MAACGDGVVLDRGFRSWSNSDQGREWRWSCGTRAEPLAIGMGDGEGEGGRGDTVHALGAVELPIIEAWSGLAAVRTVAVLQLWLCNVEIIEICDLLELALEHESV